MVSFNIDYFLKQFSFFKQDFSEKIHYLDNAAITQIPDLVIDAQVKHDKSCRANVNRGNHYLAERATEAYENARSVVASYLNIEDAEEIIFTSGTTAGINIIAQTFGQNLNPGDEILLSQLEHHSNLVPWQMLKNQTGVTLRFLPVKEDGCLDLTKLDEFITSKTKLVAITHGSNVTASITNIAPIAQLAHQCGAKILLDGAQMVANGPLNLPEFDIDFYVFSGHKVFGPNGIGALWGRKEILQTLSPVFGGGEMIQNVSFTETEYAEIPHRFEAGTPPITQAIGLATALSWMKNQDIDGIHSHLKKLVIQIINGLNLIDRGREIIRILGPDENKTRLSLVSFVIRGIHPHDICQVLNNYFGVAVRGGFHCAQPLHELWNLDGSTRASLAPYNSESDVHALLNGIEECLRIFQ